MLGTIATALETKDKYVVLYFTASWCGPCKMFKNVISAFLNQHNDDLEFIKIDVDQHPNLAVDYSINSVPTLLFFKNKILIDRRSGILSLDALKQIISN